MLERFPILTLLLLSIGTVLFAFLAVWLWLSVGLIWATLLIIGGLLAAGWLYARRPGFLGGGHHGHA